MTIRKITPEEYGKLPAYAQGLYSQSKPFGNYILNKFGEKNRIAYLYYL